VIEVFDQKKYKSPSELKALMAIFVTVSVSTSSTTVSRTLRVKMRGNGGEAAISRSRFAPNSGGRVCRPNGSSVAKKQSPRTPFILFFDCFIF
jgi:hypothetical protein